MMQCKPTHTTDNQLTSASQQQEQTIDSPMQIRLINFLGLRNYLMEKFIFRRKQPTYKIRKQQGKTKLFLPQEYKPPVRYSLQVGIIEYGKHSIPFVKLIPRSKNMNTKHHIKIASNSSKLKSSSSINVNNQTVLIKDYSSYYDTIVYAHGNSSDMADGLRFMQRMAMIYQAQYVVFDYSGYGQSRCQEVGEEIIVKDLEIVIAWLNKPLNQIILWGFSLGSYPVLHVASRYHIKGVILQCPIASVSCFFHSHLTPQIKFKQDYFANINLIPLVKSKIFMVHSHADQIIPIEHVQLLFDKYTAINGPGRIFFIEVMKLSHNGLHKYIVAQKSNDLQKEVLAFLDGLNINNSSPGTFDENLSRLKEKIKNSKIYQNDFDEGNYELVEGGNVGIKSKKIKTNCLCFPQEPSLKSIRQKFRSN